MFAILWHYGALFILLGSVTGALVAAAKESWVVTIWLLPLGIFVYIRMIMSEDRVLVAEWKRYRRRGTNSVSP